MNLNSFFGLKKVEKGQRITITFKKGSKGKKREEILRIIEFFFN